MKNKNCEGVRVDLDRRFVWPLLVLAWRLLLQGEITMVVEGEFLDEGEEYAEVKL